jgi:hypothetical protein
MKETHSISVINTTQLMLCGEITTLACELHTDAQVPCLGRMWNCLILNMVVHKANTGSQRAKNQNVGIYHVPDKCVFRNLVILFQGAWAGLCCICFDF